MVKVLFVCLGNICRSPAAEAIMNKFIENQNLKDKIICDSAGTSAYHVGEKADHRMRKVAKEKSYQIEGLSRQFILFDLEKFDYIIAMDDQNYKDILSLSHNNQYREKVFRLKEFCKDKSITEVPDPYYQGIDGFTSVINILEDGCHGLLEKIKKDKAL